MDILTKILGIIIGFICIYSYNKWYNIKRKLNYYINMFIVYESFYQDKNKPVYTNRQIIEVLEELLDDKNS